MATWVILLRGINLGAHNKVPMPKLRDAMTGAGFEDVRSYVQSGNLVAGSPYRSRDKVAAAVRDLVGEQFGVEVPVVVRTPSDVAAVISQNPFPEAAEARPKQLHVSFLTAEPSPEGVDALIDDPLAKDTCRILGDNLFIDYATGVHGSKLTPDFLARRLGVHGTARNWRTVLAVADLCGSGANTG